MGTELQNERLLRGCSGGDVGRTDVRVSVGGQTRGVRIVLLERRRRHVKILAAYGHGVPTLMICELRRTTI